MNNSNLKSDGAAKRTRQFTFLCAFLKQQQQKLRAAHSSPEQSAGSSKPRPESSAAWPDGKTLNHTA